jgi:hypothetical protein
MLARYSIAQDLDYWDLFRFHQSFGIRVKSTLILEVFKLKPNSWFWFQVVILSDPTGLNFNSNSKVGI